MVRHCTYACYLKSSCIKLRTYKSSRPLSVNGSLTRTTFFKEAGCSPTVLRKHSLYTLECNPVLPKLMHVNMYNYIVFKCHSAKKSNESTDCNYDFC